MGFDRHLSWAEKAHLWNESTGIKKTPWNYYRDEEDAKKDRHSPPENQGRFRWRGGHHVEMEMGGQGQRTRITAGDVAPSNVCKQIVILAKSATVLEVIRVERG